MSRCARTDAILEAAFGSGITIADTDHAMACPECARALAAARRFEGELHEIGTALSPEPMPAPEEVLVDNNGFERRAPGRRLVTGAVLVASLAGAFFLGGQWLGGTFGSMFQAQDGPLGGAGDAAALIGAPIDGVLVTEDGVIGIRDLGERFELVLVREADGALEEFVIDTLHERQIGVLVCADEQLGRSGFVWGSWPGVVRVDGARAHVIRGGELVLSTFDPSASARSVTLVDRGERMTEVSLSRMHAVECLEPHAAGEPGPLPPEAVHCREWQALDPASQLSVTEAVIFESLLPAVRAREQLPDATVDEVIRAARSSIDKGCQDPANAGTLVPDVAARLYGP